jgi:hypothetical protein
VKSRNKALKEHLAELRARAITAKTPADIDKAAEAITSFSKQQKYQFNHTFAIIALFFAALMAILSYWGQMDLSYQDRIWLRLAAGVSAIGAIAVIWLRYSTVKKAGDLLYVRAVAIQAGIVRDYEYNGKEYWRQLKALFPIFKCGDEGQSITKRYLGGVDSTPFTLFEFKYVDVSTSTTTDSNGSTRTSKSKTTKYKYGVLVQFSDFNYLTLNSKRFQARWDSASRSFNKLFKVGALTEMHAAKFFEPKVVLAFTDKFNFVKSLDVTGDSVACIELPKQVFPSEVRKPKLKETALYLQGIDKPASIPILELTKDLVQFINQNK